MVRILIAEDEYLELSMLSKILKRHFEHIADIRTVDNGLDALSTADIWKADVVLLDIEMPGLNGIEAAKSLLKSNPHTKVIFITAYERFDYAQEAVKLHANDFLLKPVDDAALIEVVGKTISEVVSEHNDSGVSSVEGQQKADENNKSGSKASHYITRIINYINRNYMYDISLESLSNALKLSPAYLSRIFHQNFGTGVIEYINTVRIEKAKSLLEDPSKSTREIAEAVGYQSASYFSKIFKQRTNLTPTEYRLNNVKNTGVNLSATTSTML